jgi:hypothetical protein
MAAEYFRGAGGRILDDEGFFDTGDVATIDEHGFMQITDRAKDVIKSGGEWISTIEIENIAVGHPKAALAAVVGAAHPKWDERPVLLVKLKDGETATKEEFLDYLQGKIAKWWMPDDVVIVDDIPLGATGKIDKKVIRKRLADDGYVLPSIAAAVVAAPILAAADGSHASVIYAPDQIRPRARARARGYRRSHARTGNPASLRRRRDHRGGDSDRRRRAGRAASRAPAGSARASSRRRGDRFARRGPARAAVAPSRAGCGRAAKADARRRRRRRVHAVCGADRVG